MTNIIALPAPNSPLNNSQFIKTKGIISTINSPSEKVLCAVSVMFFIGSLLINKRLVLPSCEINSTVYC